MSIRTIFIHKIIFTLKKMKNNIDDKAPQVAKRVEAQKAQPNHFSGGGSSLISRSPVPLNPTKTIFFAQDIYKLLKKLYCYCFRAPVQKKI